MKIIRKLSISATTALLKDPAIPEFCLGMPRYVVELFITFIARIGKAVKEGLCYNNDKLVGKRRLEVRNC